MTPVDADATQGQAEDETADERLSVESGGSQRHPPFTNAYRAFVMAREGLVAAVDDLLYAHRRDAHEGRLIRSCAACREGAQVTTMLADADNRAHALYRMHRQRIEEREAVARLETNQEHAAWLPSQPLSSRLKQSPPPVGEPPPPSL